MDLELRHLRAVVEIADAGSVSAAARKLDSQQPALTAQLRRIEETVGGRLFDRGPQGVRPTALGEYVIANAKVILADAARLTGSMRQRVQADQPWRLGGYGSAPMAEFAVAMRELVLDREVAAQTDADSARLAELTARGMLQVALLRDVPEPELELPEELESHLVVPEDPPFVCLPEEHRLASGDRVHLADLAEDRWVMSTPGDADLLPVLRAACRRYGFAPELGALAADTRHIEDFVRAGEGVALVGTRSSADPGYVVLPLEGAQEVRRRWLVVWRRDSEAARLGDKIRQAATAAFGRAYASSEPTRSWFLEHPEAFPGFAAHAEDDGPSTSRGLAAV